MPLLSIGNIFTPGQYNNYLIAGNFTNAFALGEIGSEDDFYLIGCEPPEEINYPLLSGNILDSNGKLLFKLKNNVLVVNPAQCSKIIGDMVGYEIHDLEGKLILKVETKFREVSQLDNEEFWITTIEANFYNKNGELVFEANSGGDNEYIKSQTKAAFGFAGGNLKSNFGYTPDDENLVRLALHSGGKIYQKLTGVITGQQLNMDGKVLVDSTIQGCEIFLETGDFALLGSNTISGCTFSLNGPAYNIYQLLSRVNMPSK